MEINPLYGQPVGTKIKKVRELKNLTQEHVAEQVGMTTSGYSRIERGEVRVSIERLEQIARALGVQPNDLTNFDENVFFTNYGTANDNSFSIRADKELLQQVIATYEARIADLKDEIQFLRGVLKV
jgi:transcriptional regulator with XRE-family HTH domain